MNNDMSHCFNKTCQIREDCQRFSDSGPQCDMQWVAAFQPTFASGEGWMCEGLLPKATSAVFGTGKDENG